MLYVLPYGQMSLWGLDIPILTFCIPPFSVIKPDKKFMAMFIGFMDGDGYFDIGEQKQYNKITKTLVKSTIRIRLASNVNVRDISLLEYCFAVKVLGVGKISNMSGGREQVRVIFSKKDLVTVILPLIKEYNLQFLTSQRVKQFAIVNYILENSITQPGGRDNVQFKEPKFIGIPFYDLVKLDFFGNWLVGFTIAEGSFGMKTAGSAFYQLRQTGDDNLDLLKAACLKITGREAYPIKADSVGSYQLSLSSKIDIEKVVSFFSSSNYHPLYGYKLSQYNLWLTALKNSSRYSKISHHWSPLAGSFPSLREPQTKILILMKNLVFNIKNTMYDNGCPKCWVISFLIILFSVWLFIYSCQSIIGTSLFSSTPFYSTFQAVHLLDSLSIKDLKNIKGYNRIGPHNKDIISIIFGSLLGKGSAERKKDGTRITFYQEAVHVKYLLLLHNQLQTAGYCNPTVPKIGTKLGKKGKVYRTIKFSTLTYTSFDWIYDLWYVNGIKVVPQSISDYLTPLALAIWVMDSGVKSSGGLNFISCFSYSDCLLIVQVLQKNFGLKARILSTGKPSQYNVYIPKESMIDLKNKVSAFIIPKMKYKLLP